MYSYFFIELNVHLYYYGYSKVFKSVTNGQFNSKCNDKQLHLTINKNIYKIDIAIYKMSASKL